MVTPKVSVNIVTFNSAGDIAACLESLRRQTFQDFHIHILDNASSDGTLHIVEPFDVDYLMRSPTNTGFCRAHNELARRFPSEYVLFLNPDTVLTPAFIEELVCALDAHPEAASASGKLIRMDGKTIDSTGIIMLREQRHLDRGECNEAGEIFGPSGAASMYRRKALDDAGATTVVIAPHGGEIQGVKHDEKGKKIKVDMKLGDSDAEDLSSDVWLDVARGLARFDGDASAFRAWVFTIARRRVIDVGRRVKRRR